MSDLIIDTQGKLTPFVKETLNPMAYSEQEKADFKQKVEALKAVPESDLIDETPTYWNPRAGEVLIGTFIGLQSRTDKKTGEMKFLATFHDGVKLTVAGQVAVMDFARTATYGCAYKITCLTAVSEKAKTFKFQKQ
jgi:hypothetical protein